VGPTAAVSGIDYDPLIQRLVGHDGGTRLYNIDPATGQATVRAELPGGGGWEGLAIITAPDVVTAVDPRVADVEAGRLILKFQPNPLPAAGDVSFEVPRAGHVTACVYDLAGRRLATIYRGSLPAGPQRLGWDGRDDAGRAVASGTYFVDVRTAGTRGTAKVIVTR